MTICETQDRITKMPNDYFLCVFEQKYSNKLRNGIGIELYNWTSLQKCSKHRLDCIIAEIENTNMNKQIIKAMEHKHSKLLKKVISKVNKRFVVTNGRNASVSDKNLFVSANSRNKQVFVTKLGLLYCLENELMYYTLQIKNLSAFWQNCYKLHKQIKKGKSRNYTNFISNCITESRQYLRDLDYCY